MDSLPSSNQDIVQAIEANTRALIELTAVTGSIPNKSTDVAGWTVYDNGVWKEYAYMVSGTTASIPASSGAALSSISLPTGMSSLATVRPVVSYYSTAQEVLFMLNSNPASATSITIRAYNTYPGASLSATYAVIIRLIEI